MVYYDELEQGEQDFIDDMLDEHECGRWSPVELVDVVIDDPYWEPIRSDKPEQFEKKLVILFGDDADDSDVIALRDVVWALRQAQEQMLAWTKEYPMGYMVIFPPVRSYDPDDWEAVPLTPETVAEVNQRKDVVVGYTVYQWEGRWLRYHEFDSGAHDCVGVDLETGEPVPLPESKTSFGHFDPRRDLFPNLT